MYTPTIGLEIHAELLTESKLFCGCRNAPNEGEPNSYVCPVCLGYPGALPALNKMAVEQLLRIGVALQGELAEYTRFDRKHYFYPDIPKGYQISQYPYPFVRNAVLLGVAIERVHLEEDTAKSAHDVLPDASMIDFNRSGVPLMELVTKPVLHTASQARQFAELLQLTLRYLGAGRGRMEWGEMRVEANISVSTTDQLGTKVEVKNLNSFKAVEGAIAYEIARQSTLLDEGGVVASETRGWNEHTKKTVAQRSKETAAEYRYLPEPDLLSYDLSSIPEWHLSRLATSIPELPEARLHRYIDEGVLSEAQALLLVKHTQLGDVYDSATAMLSSLEEKRLAANYLTSDIAQYVEDYEEVLFERIDGTVLSELVSLITDGTLSSRGAKDTLAHIVMHGGMPRRVAEEIGSVQESDTDALVDYITAVLEEHGEVVVEYRQGKEKAAQFLVGQVMKKTKGTANPKVVQELLRTHLSQQ